MSFGLLAPAALAALLAGLAPLALHIARRDETRSVIFAALRWLGESPRPRRRWRIIEPLLLVLRLLLVAAVVIALARPVLLGATDRRPVTAVVPGVDLKAVGPLTGRAVWLAPGFPPLTAPRPTRVDAPASLIRQLDAETPAGVDLQIVSPPVLDGLDSQRLTLSRPVRWRVAQAAPLSDKPAPPKPPALTVRFDAAHADAIRYLRAATTAWGAAPRFDAGALTQAPPRDAGVLVWLSNAPPSADILAPVEKGGVLILSSDAPSPAETAKAIVWRDASGAPLATTARFGAGRVLQFARPLAPDVFPALLEPEFPTRLLDLITPPPAPARGAVTALSPEVAPSAPSLVSRDLAPWWALAAAVLFAVERWLASRRRRDERP